MDFSVLMYPTSKVLTGQIFWIGTVRYAEGLWRMRRHGPVIANYIHFSPWSLWSLFTSVFF